MMDVLAYAATSEFGLVVPTAMSPPAVTPSTVPPAAMAVVVAPSAMVIMSVMAIIRITPPAKAEVNARGGRVISRRSINRRGVDGCRSIHYRRLRINRRRRLVNGRRRSINRRRAEGDVDADADAGLGRGNHAQKYSS